MHLIVTKEQQVNRATQKISGVLLGALVLATSAAIASRDGDSDSERGEYRSMQTEQSAAGLEPEGILSRLRAEGYSDFVELERERDRYEVKARNADGRWVEVYVDSSTGEVLHTEFED